MEFLEALGCWAYVFGIAALYLLLAWTIDRIKEHRETAMYRRRLRQAAARIATLDVEALSRRATSLQQRHSSIDRLMRRRYGHGGQTQYGETTGKWMGFLSEYIEADAESQRRSRHATRSAPERRQRSKRRRYWGRY